MKDSKKKVELKTERAACCAQKLWISLRVQFAQCRKIPPDVDGHDESPPPDQAANKTRGLRRRGAAAFFLGTCLIFHSRHSDFLRALTSPLFSHLRITSAVSAHTCSLTDSCSGSLPRPSSDALRASVSWSAVGAGSAWRGSVNIWQLIPAESSSLAFLPAQAEHLAQYYSRISSFWASGAG